MSGHHVSDRESFFLVMNITPDFCFVNGKIIAYDISRDLTNELTEYDYTLHARGKPVLKRGSRIQGVDGNQGKGVLSGVSLAKGNNLAVEGSATVHVGGRPLCRHHDFVMMNGK